MCEQGKKSGGMLILLACSRRGGGWLPRPGLYVKSMQLSCCPAVSMNVGCNQHAGQTCTHKHNTSGTHTAAGEPAVRGAHQGQPARFV